VASIRKDINKVNQEGVSDQPHAYFMHIKELRKNSEGFKSDLFNSFKCKLTRMRVMKHVRPREKPQVSEIENL